MKTKIVIWLFMIIMLAGLIDSQTSYASTPATVCASTIWQKFQGKIRYPETAYKQAVEGDVTVIFTVSDDGKIIVKFMRSTDQELESYVRDIISTIQCPELENAGIYDFKVTFHFKLI